MSEVKMYFLSALKKVMPQEKVLSDGTKFGNLYKYGRLHFQFVVFSDKILIDGRIKIETNIPTVKMERIGYVPSMLPVREDHDDYIVSKSPGLYPDSILPVNKDVVRIVPGINNCFMITVEDDGSLKEDEYPVTVSLYNKEECVCRSTFSVRFIEEEFLPSDVLYTNWVHYDSISAAHAVKPFTKRYYRILRSYLGHAKYSGMNCVFVPLITPPLDTYVGGYRKNVQLAEIFYDGDYHFNFEKLGRFIDFTQENGINEFEFPPFFSQWNANYAAPFVVKTKRGMERRFGWEKGSLSEEYAEFLSKFLQSLATYLKEKGVFEHCYFHVCDEAHGEDERYEKCRKLVTDNLPGGKFIDAKAKLSGKEHHDFIEVLSLSEADKSIECGVSPKAIYYCWGDYKNSLSNRFFSMPLSRTAVIWPQLYLNDAQIFLHWGFNFYQDYLSYHYIDPYSVTDCGGIFPSGDAFIVYPDLEGDGAVPSLRLYAFAYGKQIYCMLKTLESLTDKEYVKKILERFGMKGYGNYPHDDEWLYHLEEELIQEISNRRKD